MSEVAAAGSSFIPRLGSLKPKRQRQRQWHVVTQPPKCQPVINNQMVNPSTYTSRISTDLPLYEAPGVTLSLSLLHAFFLFCWGIGMKLSFFVWYNNFPRLCLMNIWRTSPECSKQYFQTKEEANELTRFAHAYKTSILL